MGRSRSLTDRPGNFVKHLSVVTSILSNLLWQCITRYDPGFGNLYLHIFPHDSKMKLIVTLLGACRGLQSRAQKLLLARQA